MAAAWPAGNPSIGHPQARSQDSTVSSPAASRAWMWRRDRSGHPAGPGLVHHSDAGSQYTSFRFTAHLIESGIDASIGTVGDAYDNALMESAVGLYKTELIKRKGPWKTLAEVELATAEYTDWFSNRRLHSAIGPIPPAEHEASYYAQTEPGLLAGANN